MVLQVVTLSFLQLAAASRASPNVQNCTDGRTCSRVDEGSSEDCKVMVNLSSSLDGYVSFYFA
jgi:hypothetical protein